MLRVLYRGVYGGGASEAYVTIKNWGVYGGLEEVLVCVACYKCLNR